MPFATFADIEVDAARYAIPRQVNASENIAPGRQLKER